MKKLKLVHSKIFEGGKTLWCIILITYGLVHSKIFEGGKTRDRDAND